MPPDLIHSLLSNTWSIFLIILFFGGSIFVHELGHFLAARSQGSPHVEVFSIGMGSPHLLVDGGQRHPLPDRLVPAGRVRPASPRSPTWEALEGESQLDVAKLPPVSYGSKLLVFVAGAFFNVVFAFLLACIIWKVGQPANIESVSTTVGYVAKTVDLPDGSKAPSPALAGGLRVGDVVEVDRRAPGSGDWDDLHDTLVMGSGRDVSGGRSTLFTIERDGHAMDLTLHPVLSGDEKWRQVGILPGYKLTASTRSSGLRLREGRAPRGRRRATRSTAPAS